MRYVWLLLVSLAGCGGSLEITATTDGSTSAIDGGADMPAGTPCGALLCGPGEVCEGDLCHIDCGATGVRCGTPEVCCADGDLCHLGACTTPGATCLPAPDAGHCPTEPCPEGAYCEATIWRCLPSAPTASCEYSPPTGQFAPVVKWEWQGSDTGGMNASNQIMMTPMVGDLDGDCLPEIVFSTFAGDDYTHSGVVRAVHGDGSGEVWSLTDPSLRVAAGGQLALADVDEDAEQRLTVFACHESKALMAIRFDGTLRWLASDQRCEMYDAPAVADVDHDGQAEVIVGFAVYDAQTGALRNTPPTAPSATGYGHYVAAVELDGDAANGMELVSGGIVYHWDGSLYWNRIGCGAGCAQWSGLPAVADLDLDHSPEIVSAVYGEHKVYAFRFDGTLLWGPVDVNNGVPIGGNPSGGGPPTIADFDGDGHPDVALAGGYGYLVLRGSTGEVLWQNTDTRDYSSRMTGSSVFDFEGDGVAEAVYNDELNLRVYRGYDGLVLLKTCNTSATLWEYPVIVDVDADDHAEIVVMSNNYYFSRCQDETVDGGVIPGPPSHTGFKVIGDSENRWVRTRRLWNQHAYHVSNVLDDGRIPQLESDHWMQAGLNSFRQNIQTTNLLAAPNLIIGTPTGGYGQCGQGTILLRAQITNQGAAGAPAGVPVTFYLETVSGSTAIATTATTAVLLPGASHMIEIPWTPGTGVTGPFSISVVVDDDGNGGTLLHECDTSDNRSPITSIGCPTVG